MSNETLNELRRQVIKQLMRRLCLNCYGTGVTGWLFFKRRCTCCNGTGYV